MRLLAGILLLTLLSNSTSSACAQAPADLAIRCGKLYVTGDKPMQDAWLVVRGGKVASIVPVAEQPEPPAGLTVLDARDRVVIPGLVAADTDLAGHVDQPQQITPDFVALDGFDLVLPRKRVLSGGVTTVYLSPGRLRLISGQGSVVKTFGDDLVQRILSESACLRITLGRESTNAPPLFEPTIAPTADDPLVPAKRQWPSARLSQLAELRRVFEAAKAGQDGTDDGGFDEDNWQAHALLRVTRGQLPLRVAAREAQDISRALRLAVELKSKLVLEGPEQLDQVADAAREAGATAIYRLPVRPGQSNPGGEDRRDKSVYASPDAPARAAAAGIAVALTAAADDDLRDLLMIGAIAVRHGLKPELALRAMTDVAATALGVQDRVGSLTVGMDADLVVLTGEPFAVGTLVEHTYVGGKLAYQRKSSNKLLALRVDRILTGEGTSIQKGVILIEDGKIRSVGEDLAIPQGAELLAVPGVATPGLIDSYSQLGLSGEGAAIPVGAPDQLVGEAVLDSDKWLRAAAAAGLTTALVSGRDGGLVSGRVAAVKTDGVVLKATAAQRFVHDAIGPDAIKPMADAIQRARQYIESWQRYDKAVADWKAGKAEKPKEVPVEAPVADDPVSGTWEIELKDLPVPFPILLRLVVKLEGNKVTGTVTTVVNNRPGQSNEIQEGNFEAGTLRCKMRGFGGEATVEAKIENDQLTGSLDGGQLRATLVGKRVSKETTATAATTSSTGEPTKPRVDESLEPLRAICEGKIPAVVRCNRGQAIQDVVKWFADQKLPLLLHGATDAIRDGANLTVPGILLGPDVLDESDAETVNLPARATERGTPVALCSGDVAGARYLPIHAAYAVRYGMDPQEALKAMTSYPARMFMLEDRVGSIKRGKDADLVVWSGDPFDLQSRVILTIVNGKVVVDNRKEIK